MAAPGRPDYDQALKALLTCAHDGVLALLAPDLTFVAERPTALPAERREADLVWEVDRPDGRRGLFHLELQTRLDDDLGERLLEYVVRLYRYHHRPVRTVVVLLRETGRRVPLPLRFEWGGAMLLAFDCDVVRLWELPRASVLDRPEPWLWPLATLMAGATVETAAEVAGRLVPTPSLAPAERREALALTTGLAGLRLPREAMRQVLRRDPMLRDILRDSSLTEILREEWLPEFKEEWRRESVEQGRQECLEAGRREGQHELVRQALEDRFSVLAPDEQATLAAADAVTLRAVVAHLATDSREQARARLGLA